MKRLTVTRTATGAVSLTPLKRAQRSCGGCRACCFRYPIHAIEKPKRSTCPNSCEAGCSLHGTEAKPDECVNYKCLWLIGLGNTSDRPDKIGAIFDSPQEPSDYLSVNVTRTEHPLNAARVKALISMVESYGNLVIFDTDHDLEIKALGPDSFLRADAGMVIARATLRHKSWRAAAEAMTAGVDVPFLPPKCDAEFWAKAKEAAPRDVLLKIAEQRMLEEAE